MIAFDPAPTSTEPIRRFARWYEEATSHEAIRYPHAACLATVGREGADARVVLVHAVDATGFVFGTDIRSTKARQLARDPNAALVFDWSILDRQVRIRGPVEMASDSDADLTFDDRPRPSRITAWAAEQSRTIANRAALEARWQEAARRFEDDRPVPRPESWRAYRLRPQSIELWRAGARRLHDRARYLRGANGVWQRARLQP